MIDIQLVRDRPEWVKEKSAQKLVDVNITQLLKLDTQRADLLRAVETLRQARNENADKMKQSSGKPDSQIIEDGKRIKTELTEKETELDDVAKQWHELLLAIPNMPSDDTPVGASEDENVVVKQVGTPRVFDFEPRSDAELGKSNDIIDKEKGAVVAGSRFAYLKGGLAHMQIALLQFVIDTVTDETTLKSIADEAGLDVPTKPFTFVLPPPMLNTKVYSATARLNGADVTYKLEDDDLWLNGSAEHSLCCYYMDEILEERDLPIRMLGYGTAFRREAGTYGKDMEGIFRMHHFDKAEMESFTTAETSMQEHLFLVAIQEYLTAKIGIPYQVKLKCTADIGNPNARGIDIEMWMPSQKKYRETHSADLITDYQTRRLKTRVRRLDGEVQLAHTNDATAFAMGRTLKAIIENYQTREGTIEIPMVLQKYMGGRTHI
jgi:seryl-tRNA synthetase